MPIGYKVCLQDSKGTIHSLYVYSSLAKVEYKIGEWVRPRTKCGPMVLFKNKERAIAYVKKLEYTSKQTSHSYSNVWVFRCEYVKSRATKIWYPFIYSHRKDNKPTYYRILCSLEELIGYFNEVALATRVKITERIY